MPVIRILRTRPTRQREVWNHRGNCRGLIPSSASLLLDTKYDNAKNYGSQFTGDCGATRFTDGLWVWPMLYLSHICRRQTATACAWRIAPNSCGIGDTIWAYFVSRVKQGCPYSPTRHLADCGRS